MKTLYGNKLLHTVVYEKHFLHLAQLFGFIPLVERKAD